MAEPHTTHDSHSHVHGPNCGHTAVEHNGHTDYLHDGHMHHAHGGHVDEHTLEASATNRTDCTPKHDCGGHDMKHAHNATCGHDRVPHADHLDYLVNGHLHHPHDGHCDDHGPLERSK